MKSEPPFEETKVQKAFVSSAEFEELPILNWSDANGEHSFQPEHKSVVGSAAGNGLVIADSAVSRLHAEFELREDGLWIRDLGSRNGTYVEGLRVEMAKIPDKGRIRVGGTTIDAHYGAVRSKVDLWPHASFGQLVGQSVVMRKLFAALARVADVDSSVLIQGETGTGKELVARAIHDRSPRASAPFVVVDCAALPETLLDSELFGHTKGAFTGAMSARAGAIETAEGGTVLLDEIGELPLPMQPKLLRTLESRTVRRIGESEHRKVDVRFIAATHRDLPTMINRGEFREDLYFRLAVLPVLVPPLCQRADDIELLVERFLPKGKAMPDPNFIRELTRKMWRGNVRELRNFVERAVALGPVEALASYASMKTTESPESRSNTPLIDVDGTSSAEPSGPSFNQGFKTFRDEWIESGERKYLRQLLARHERNVSSAALEAGVDRTYIYRLIRKYDL